MKNLWALVGLSIMMMVSCSHKEHKVHEESTFFVTHPILKDTTIYNEYVCQIRSFQHIELRALEKGYLEKILVDEGRFVKKGQLLFQIQPTIYQAEAKKVQAELNIVQIEYQNTKALADSNIVSSNELALAEAKLERARADLALANAHVNFTEIRAPFDGIVGKFEEVRLGSLLDEGELLTTLSDNSKMWVYFNVPEAQYLDYAMQPKSSGSQRVKLRLANNHLFSSEGVIETIESDFDHTTGNIAFRATFKNPSLLLRHGQTGTILWPKGLKDVLVIPQKSTFEILDKRYVFKVDEDGRIHSQEISIKEELNHAYLINGGLSIQDKILLEGLRKVKDGDHIQYKLKDPTSVYDHLELHAE